MVVGWKVRPDVTPYLQVAPLLPALPTYEFPWKGAAPIDRTLFKRSRPIQGHRTGSWNTSSLGFAEL